MPFYLSGIAKPTSLAGAALLFCLGLFPSCGGDASSSQPAAVATANRPAAEISMKEGEVLNSVAYGNGTLVAVGDLGNVMISKDMSTWTAQSSGTDSVLFGVAFGNGRFVAVGMDGTLLTSTDGTGWTQVASVNGEALYGVAFGSGAFVAVGANGTALVSQNGVEWGACTTGVTNWLYGVLSRRIDSLPSAKAVSS